MQNPLMRWKHTKNGSKYEHQPGLLLEISEIHIRTFPNNLWLIFEIILFHPGIGIHWADFKHDQNSRLIKISNNDYIDYTYNYCFFVFDISF